ncbi:hypothetical protein BD414DRAFT_441235 [Trametes punicea]|nr:hypothetical protein BD414DRAFT_441235 [Trametes punicea]
MDAAFSLPTMPHPALSCYDILFAVFQHLESPEETWYDYDPTIQESSAWHIRHAAAENRRTLASCAQVCRAFFQPAVALLWRDVDDTSQLFDLLRAAPLCSAEPIAGRCAGDEKGKLACLSNQAARALQYAWHVRAIHGPRKQVRSHRDQSRLPAWVQMQPLFPQLRYLRWTMSASHRTNCDFAELVPSSLHGLHLVFPRQTQGNGPSTAVSDRPCQDFARKLTSEFVLKARSLRYLRITVLDKMHESWLDSVSGLPLGQLETFDLESPPEASAPLSFLRPLAALQYLRHLGLRLPGSVPAVGADAFPSLCTLMLDANLVQLRAISAFLSTISSHSLESLTLLNCQSTSAAINFEMHELADILRRRFSGSLRRLVLNLLGTSHPQAEPQSLTKTLEPLLDVHAMSDLTLSLSRDVHALTSSKEDLRKMAKAWPKVTRLHLSYGGAALSVHDLEYLAHHCASLTDLIIPAIDASVSQGEDVLLRRQYLPRHGLRFLSLHDGGTCSTIPNPGRLARWLDTLFPKVDWRCPRGGSEPWQDTVEELVQLRIARLIHGNVSNL